MHRAQHAINAIWRALRTCKVVQLIKFITSLKRWGFEMPNGTYSNRYGQFQNL